MEVCVYAYLVSAMALVLSPMMGNGCASGSPISLSCWSRWIASDEVLPSCMYSASHEDLAQRVWRFEDHEMAPPLRVKT